MENRRITILGLGNILLSDEGFGVHFVRYIEQKYIFPENVELIDGGVMGYVLLDIFDRSDIMIVIDCIKLGDKPGSIFRFTHEEFLTKIPPPTSAHEVKFSDVLIKAEMMGDLPEIVFLCIIPKEFKDMELEMTDELKNRLPVMEGLLLKELERFGVKPETRHA
ncbi:MAG TPA: HyaD/HybD family hydrogenase maturation endopeptidase [Desulfomonilia bacterium]